MFLSVDFLLDDIFSMEERKRTKIKSVTWEIDLFQEFIKKKKYTDHPYLRRKCALLIITLPIKSACFFFCTCLIITFSISIFLKVSIQIASSNVLVECKQNTETDQLITTFITAQFISKLYFYRVFFLLNRNLKLFLSISEERKTKHFIFERKKKKKVRFFLFCFCIPPIINNKLTRNGL